MPGMDWQMRQAIMDEYSAGQSYSPIGLTQDALDEAVYDMSGFSGVIPEHSTTWARDGEDQGRTCTCALTNAEAAEHSCPGAPASEVGERALALSHVSSAVENQDSGSFYDEDAEIIRLSTLNMKDRQKKSAHTLPGSTDFPIPDKSHLAAAIREYHAGNYAGHSREEVAAHIQKRGRELGVQVHLSADVELAAPQVPSAFGSPEAAVAHYRQMLVKMGLTPPAETDDYGNTTDPRQPRKGNKAYPSVKGGIFEHQLGGGEHPYYRSLW